jgi:transposase
MVHPVQVRSISNDEGNRLLRIVRRGTGSVVTWRRAQMVLLSAQGMPVAKIAEVTFTSPDRVRDVLHNFTADGFDSLYPRYAGGRPPKFDLKQRAEITKIALSRPEDHDLPFSVWSLAKLADFLVAEGVVDDISHEGLRALLRDEGVSFQAVKTFKASTDPDYDAKTARVLALYAIADEVAQPGPGDPTVVFCVDEFGPLNLQPHPGKQWAPKASGKGDPAVPRRRRRRATYTRPHGVRHLLAALDLSRDRLYGHVTPRKGRTQFLALPLPALPTAGQHAHRDHLRQLQPAPVHQPRRPGRTVGRGEQRRDRLHPVLRLLAQPHRAAVTALRYFALDGTDHATHREQAGMIRRYIAWRNRHTTDPKLRKVIKRASTITRAKVA